MREFVMPAEEEINERRTMYAKAEESGIDFMHFDDEKGEDQRRDIRQAVVYLGAGREVPAELKERIIAQRQQKSVK